MAQLRVLLGFAQDSDQGLIETAGAVRDGMTNNPLYPNPPVTMAALGQALDDFVEAVAIAAKGSQADTADKNQKREVLIGLLRQLAAYVQQTAKNLADLTSSGFDAVSTSRAQTQLDKPAITAIKNGLSTQLILVITAIANARVYEVRYSEDGGATWQSAGLYQSTRGMIVHGLTPGRNYTVQVRAVGGSTTYSDWSDAVQHRSL
jgi:hypothetical protein